MEGFQPYRPCCFMWQAVITSPHKEWCWQGGVGIQGELLRSNPIPYQDEPWVLSFLTCMSGFLCKHPGVQAGRQLLHRTVTSQSEQTLDQELWGTKVRNANSDTEKLGLILADNKTFAIRCAFRFLERLNKNNTKDVVSLPSGVSNRTVTPAPLPEVSHASITHSVW